MFRLFHNPFKAHREVIKRKISPVVLKRLSEMKKNESYVPPMDVLQKLIENLHDNYKVDVDVITDYIITAVFAAASTTSSFVVNSLHRKLITSISLYI